MTNFDKPDLEVMKLPQVLYVGGFDGTDTITPSIIVNMIDYIFENQRTFKQLLNSRVIILVPTVNPEGLYKGVQKEENKYSV
jgi:Zinc carboxypeptidase